MKYSVLLLGVSMFAACGGRQDAPQPQSSSSSQNQGYQTNNTQQGQTQAAPVIGQTSNGPAAYLASDIQPILTASCVSCHGAGGQKPELHNAQMIQQLQPGEKQSVVNSVVSGKMPLGSPLTTQQAALFKAWGEHGYP